MDWNHLIVLSVYLCVTLAYDYSGCCGIRINNSCLKCCNNYHLVGDTCQECQPGLWGNNCSSICQYPYFGTHCIQKCECDEDICNVIKGCPKPMATSVPSINAARQTSLRRNLAAETLTTNENVVQDKEQKETTSGNGIPLSTIVVAVSVVLGLSLFTIVMLVVVLLRNRRKNGMSNAGSAELHRMHQQKSTSMQTNTYRNIQSVVGRSNSDISASHFDFRECQGRVGNRNYMITTKEKNDIQTETTSYEELDFSDSSMGTNNDGS